MKNDTLNFIFILMLLGLIGVVTVFVGKEIDKLQARVALLENKSSGLIEK